MESMAITASKKSFAKGRLCASTRNGKTLASHPRSIARLRFSLGDVSPSTAQAWTPNSRARKIELVAFPQPRSNIRMPARSGRRRARLSVWHRVFSTSALSRIHCGSYLAVRGNSVGETPSRLKVFSPHAHARAQSGLFLERYLQVKE